jgi:hypothetical protein
VQKINQYSLSSKVIAIDSLSVCKELKLFEPYVPP